mmetsp:Transcript_16210/g.37223  ORF Transcript_16210/g.37223 Transcript_16210/m.37223 type:complete len:214 (+) Transcript_16210:170-811(+)
MRMQFPTVVVNWRNVSKPWYAKIETYWRREQRHILRTFVLTRNIIVPLFFGEFHAFFLLSVFGLSAVHQTQIGIASGASKEGLRCAPSPKGAGDVSSLLHHEGFLVLSCKREPKNGRRKSVVFRGLNSLSCVKCHASQKPRDQTNVGQRYHVDCTLSHHLFPFLLRRCLILMNLAGLLLWIWVYWHACLGYCGCPRCRNCETRPSRVLSQPRM